MLSTIKKIFSDKPIRSFELDYKHYWSDRGIKQVTKRDRLIASLIEEGSKILDIGCGDGRLLSYLYSTLHVEGFGIDISEDAVRRARERGLQVECIDICNAELVKEWLFDYIIMSDFIEHIPDPEKVLMKLKGHFRKGIIITIPNTGYITLRLRLCIGGRFPVQWGKHPGEHLRFWTIKDFIWWTKQLGYRVSKIVPIRGTILKGFLPDLFSKKNIFLLSEAGVLETKES